MGDRDGSSSLERLIEQGWAYHDRESERLAVELEQAADEGVAPELLAPFLDIAVHTIGEHLGDWKRALVLGKRVSVRHVPDLETARVWARLYVAAILAGEPVDAADFELSYVEAAGQGFGAALDVRFMLVDALVASNRLREGGRLYRRALHLAGVLGDSARLDRIIAATSNNMAWELHELSSRTADENDLMRLSAETSLGYWLKCGNWINAEGAHSRSGLDHADAALAIIAANGERPLDAAQLHLARAASLAALGDALGTAEAMRSADAAAAKLQPELKARFDSVRAKAVAGSA
jgi:hypothetical protein